MNFDTQPAGWPWGLEKDWWGGGLGGQGYPPSIHRVLITFSIKGPFILGMPVYHISGQTMFRDLLEYMYNLVTCWWRADSFSHHKGIDVIYHWTLTLFKKQHLRLPVARLRNMTLLEYAGVKSFFHIGQVPLFWARGRCKKQVRIKYPLVNVNKKLWKITKSPFSSWVIPLFRLGHVPVGFL